MYSAVSNYDGTYFASRLLEGVNVTNFFYNTGPIKLDRKNIIKIIVAQTKLFMSSKKLQVKLNPVKSKNLAALKVVKNSMLENTLNCERAI